MRIKVAPLVTDVTGHVPGTGYAHRRGTLYLRRTPRSPQVPSMEMQQVRNEMATVSLLWQTLSGVQRDWYISLVADRPTVPRAEWLRHAIPLARNLPDSYGLWPIPVTLPSANWLGTWTSPAPGTIHWVTGGYWTPPGWSHNKVSLTIWPLLPLTPPPQLYYVLHDDSRISFDWDFTGVPPGDWCVNSSRRLTSPSGKVAWSPRRSDIIAVA